MGSWGYQRSSRTRSGRGGGGGESLRLIARRLGKRGPSVRAFVLQTGGVQCRPPRRAARALLLGKREEISRGLAAGDSCRILIGGLPAYKRPSVNNSTDQGQPRNPLVRRSGRSAKVIPDTTQEEPL
jgi:hypothetical protein